MFINLDDLIVSKGKERSGSVLLERCETKRIYKVRNGWNWKMD